jgi:hypothetical protein
MHMDMQPMTQSASSQAASQDESCCQHGFALFNLLTAMMLTLLLEALDQTVVGVIMLVHLLLRVLVVNLKFRPDSGNFYIHFSSPNV